MANLENIRKISSKIGQGIVPTPEELQEFQEYECEITDRKYGREHVDGEIGKHTTLKNLGSVKQSY